MSSCSVKEISLVSSIQSPCLSRFFLLAADFDRSAFAPDYKPRTFVDFLPVFHLKVPAFFLQVHGWKVSAIRLVLGDISSVAGEVAVKMRGKSTGRQQISSAFTQL